MSDADDVEPPSAEAGRIRSAVEALLGEQDLYWEVFDPTVRSQAGLGSVADDLADVYSDLRRGLDVLDRGGTAAGANHRWRLMWDMHWGRHAVGAIRALHFLRYERGD